CFSPRADSPSWRSCSPGCCGRCRFPEGIAESFASPREDRSDRELERIISAIATGRTRTDIYRRIVDESRLELGPSEAGLLGRLATVGTFEHAPPQAAMPEEIALLTARLLERVCRLRSRGRRPR